MRNNQRRQAMLDRKDQRFLAQVEDALGKQSPEMVLRALVAALAIHGSLEPQEFRKEDEQCHA
jgi:hypothetical protein